MKRYIELTILAALFLASPNSSAQEKHNTIKKHIFKQLPEGHTPQCILLQKTTPASEPIILISAVDTEKNAYVNPALKENSDLKTIKIQYSDSRVILDTDTDNLWSLEGNQLKTYSLTTGKLINTIQLPKEATAISALEIGFGGTPFIADNKEQKLFVFDQNEWQVIAEGDYLGKPTTLLRIGGSMFIGTETDLRVLDLRSKEMTIVTKGIGKVIAITEDHIGYLLILAEGNKQLLRVSLTSDVQLLPLETKDISHINFDHSKAQLLTVNSHSKTVSSWNYFDLINEPLSSWEESNSQLMHPFEGNGLVLSGSEYLIHSIENSTPKKQGLIYLQGFYPQKDVIYQGYAAPASANIKLIDCAEKSYEALQKWIQNPPIEFESTIEVGTPPLFWTMTDDYSDIKQDLLETQRIARLWYWKRNPSVPGRVPGYWKWEAVLTQDGVCQIPDSEETKQFLLEYIKEH